MIDIHKDSHSALKPDFNLLNWEHLPWVLKDI